MACFLADTHLCHTLAREQSHTTIQQSLRVLCFLISSIVYVLTAGAGAAVDASGADDAAADFFGICILGLVEVINK